MCDIRTVFFAWISYLVAHLANECDDWERKSVCSDILATKFSLEEIYSGTSDECYSYLWHLVYLLIFVYRLNKHITNMKNTVFASTSAKILENIEFLIYLIDLKDQITCPNEWV